MCTSSGGLDQSLFNEGVTVAVAPERDMKQGDINGWSVAQIHVQGLTDYILMDYILTD
jgi:hypothetical protein